MGYVACMGGGGGVSVYGVVMSLNTKERDHMEYVGIDGKVVLVLKRKQ